MNAISNISSRPVVLSFFDYTGEAVKPWALAGYECHCFDIQHAGVTSERHGLGTIWFRNADLSADSADWSRIVAQFRGRKVVMVYGFPPCTDLAVSGARHFEAKRQADPLFQHKATAMAKACAKAACELDAPYCVENPVSVLATLWRKPNHTFQPNEFGGYLPENDVHPRWPEYIAPRDAYTKRTCLWTGNGFVMPTPKPVAPIRVSAVRADGSVTTGSAQWGKLGGKSLKTKNIRSATPRGFALAAFKANAFVSDLIALKAAA